MSYVLYTKEGNYRSRAIEIASEIGGLKVDLQYIDSKDFKSKEHLARNPLGQIPVIKTPEGYIYQTNAILRYVASVGNASKTLYGSNEYEKSQVDQWLDFISSELLPAVNPINYKIWGFKDTSKEELAAANQALNKLWPLLDSSVKGKKFFVGENLSVADITFYTALVYTFRCYFDEKFRTTYPAFTAWFEGVAQQPVVQKYFGKTRYSSKPWF